jgi:hypothetical protein
MFNICPEDFSRTIREILAGLITGLEAAGHQASKWRIYILAKSKVVPVLN